MTMIERRPNMRPLLGFEVIVAEAANGGRLPTVLEALRTGRAAVERGWTQGQLRNAVADEVCLMGGLPDAFPFGALKYLARAVGVPVEALGVWNDEPGRTKAEVMDAYDHAIKFAEEDEQNK